MCLEVTTVNIILQTDVTREPSSFIVSLCVTPADVAFVGTAF